MPPLIHADNVHKRFSRKPVLRGVDLQVAAGSVTSLLGANGAGKTTLMRLIAGLAKPDRGEIALGGVRMTRSLHELRRYIGFVGHAPLLYESLTGMENLLFFADLYDVPHARERAHERLREVDLFARRNDAVRTYSRGMIQRLAIARATLHNPPVLLLDEPDTGLDPASAAMLHELIRGMRADNRAILLSTHNVERALAWADSVCILADGRIADQQGSTHMDASDVQRLLVGERRNA